MMKTLRISYTDLFHRPHFDPHPDLWLLLKFITIDTGNLGEFSRDSQFNKRIYRIHKSPRVPWRFFYLPFGTISILAQSIGVSQVEQNGISSIPGFLPLFYARVFPAVNGEMFFSFFIQLAFPKLTI